MAIRAFPPVELAGPNGLLAIGGDLEVDSLLLAYRNGIFVWEGNPIMWFAPPKRAILFLDRFKVSKSMRKAKNKFTYTINRDFVGVITNAAKAPYREKTGTWISDNIISAYIDLHRAGYAFSVEAWFDNELAGGVYGVNIANMWAGESMFYRVSEASKCALWFLVDHLKDRGIKWLDCQVINPFTKSLGAVEISRDEFMVLLEDSLNHGK